VAHELQSMNPPLPTTGNTEKFFLSITEKRKEEKEREQEHIVDEKRLLPAIRIQYSKSEQIRIVWVASNGFCSLV